jgi:hypothetical protein
MPNARAASPTIHPGPTGSATATDHPAVRTVLAGYTVTLAPLLVGLAALELGWEQTAGTTWVAAAAAVAGWALAVAGWLRLRGWRARAVRTVLGTAAAVLAAPLAVGWLSPAGLVLWGPITTVLTVALTLAEQPPASATAHPRSSR